MLQQDIRLLIVDDHDMIVEGFALLLERLPLVTVVGVAANGRDAITYVEQLQPNMVLLDISLPFRNGIDVAEEIAALYPDVRVIMLTAHREREHVVRSLRAGARGYVFKGSAFSVVV